MLESDQMVREIFSMRRTSSPAASLLLNSLILMHLEHSSKPIHSLLLFVVSTKRLIALSLDPSENFKVLLSYCYAIVEEQNSANIILILLAEMLQITSSFHIPKLIEILEALIIKNKLGHPLILHMVLDGLIQVLAYPSFSSGTLGLVEQLVKHIRSNGPQNITETSSFNSEYLKVCPELQNARDMSVMLETSSLELEEIVTEADKIFWTRNQLVLRGYFHHDATDFTKWLIVLKNLIQISKSDEALKSSLVMPLLFKLSLTQNPRMKLSILQNLTQLGATSEIFGTIKALSSGLVRSMSIDLHLRLWKIEPRTYPFLHKALVEKGSKDSDDTRLEIVRAAAIKEICDRRPQHGPDLVSIISEILNSSLDLKEGDIQASLAIDSITLLCQNHVINVVSTWKAISLTTRYEKRPRVIKSLCKFFSIIPTMKRSSLEYENLTKEILNRLWQMIQWGDKHGIECALDALKSWNYDSMTLDTIPDAYREGIELPTAPAGMEVSVLDLEVPGECFVQLLTKINPSGLQAAGALLAYYLGCEIAEFRSGHYLVKEGQPEPMNYKNLPKQSILKALTAFVIQQATTKKAEKLVEEAILVESLSILAQRYSRPLPPLNWCFLHDMLHKSEKIKVQCLKIAAKQSVISGTAKRLIENFLVNFDGNSEDDARTALESLVDLCNGISPDVMKSFSEFLFKTHSGNKRLLIKEHVVKCLAREKEITNRENLSTIISTFISNIPATAEVIRLIPPKVLDTITYQLDLQEKIWFRCEILKSPASVENPVAWINELLSDLLITDNNDQEFFLKHFIKLMTESDVFPKKKWLTDVIVLIQNRLVEKDFDESKTNFLLNLFIVSIVSTGYLKSIVDRHEVPEKILQLLPQSIELVSQQSSFADVIANIFEFLLHIINHERIRDDEIREAFKTSIVISKNHGYFKKSKVWQRFLMIG